MNIDIQNHPEIIEAMNASLNAGNTVEIKVEKTGIVVAEQIRLFKGKFKYNKGEPGTEEG